MKRIFTTILATAALSAAAFADNYSLYLEPTEGNVSEWTLTSLDKLTFRNGNIVFTTTDGAESTVPISGVRRLFFSTPEIQGIDGMGTDGSNVAWDGTCLYAGTQVGTAVTIYNAAGTVVARQTAGENGIIGFETLGKGMYIVNVQGKSYKIFKP
ncbi:MAG: T9SS type A sorting domain-containing protein [Bacteroides sp.]|nr:T9SS type A sorting domain-containing protein [Roseburia sp.]MCM1347235.1 T9SS type A sorting domain-containing protein [Bacteroides sp.]MCM1421714.1 T9SS type A sorting domain-containing protein [Bacteroides sp.]